MEMVNTRFRSTKSKERGLACQEIVAAAVPIRQQIQKKQRDGFCSRNIPIRTRLIEF